MFWEQDKQGIKQVEQKLENGAHAGGRWTLIILPYLGTAIFNNKYMY